MPAVKFYQKPVLLSREAHRHVRVRPSSSYGFAARASSMVIAGVEFVEASKHYPIVFANVGANQLAPMVVLGLRENENLFVDASGQWGTPYVPAYARRYPFVLTDLKGQQLGVCIDEAYEGYKQADGEPLFDAAGKNTPFLQSALDFLNRYQVEHMRTERFCARLQELGLLTDMNAKAELFDGTSFVVNGLKVVDERKLLSLQDASALALFRGGELGWIYAHLLSLTNMNLLVDRLAARVRAQAPLSVPSAAADGTAVQ